MTIEEKFEKLKKFFRDAGSVATAFSGGTDSTFLLKIAKEVLATSNFEWLFLTHSKKQQNQNNFTEYDILERNEKIFNHFIERLEKSRLFK